MKNIFLPIFSLVLFINCSGPTGPQGPAGLTATPNVISIIGTVKSSDYYTDNFTRFKLGFNGKVISDNWATFIYFRVKSNTPWIEMSTISILQQNYTSDILEGPWWYNDNVSFIDEDKCMLDYQYKIILIEPED